VLNSFWNLDVHPNSWLEAASSVRLQPRACEQPEKADESLMMQLLCCGSFQ